MAQRRRMQQIIIMRPAHYMDTQKQLTLTQCGFDTMLGDSEAVLNAFAGDEAVIGIDSPPAGQPDLASQDAHHHFAPPAAEVRPAGMVDMQEIARLSHEHVEGPETPADEDPDQRKGKLQEQLEEAVTGQFNIQSSLGRRFMREVKAKDKLRSDYLRLSDNKAKADFRKKVG